MLEEMDLGDMGPSPAPTPQPSTVWSRGAHAHGHAHAHDADHDANDSAEDEGTILPLPLFPLMLSTICASGLNFTHQGCGGLTVLFLSSFEKMLSFLVQSYQCARIC